MKAPAPTTPTPRTDAVTIIVPAGTFGIGNQQPFEAVMASFARELERTHAEMVAALEEIAQMLTPSKTDRELIAADIARAALAKARQEDDK